MMRGEDDMLSIVQCTNTPVPIHSPDGATFDAAIVKSLHPVAAEWYLAVQGAERAERGRKSGGRDAGRSTATR